MTKKRLFHLLFVLLFSLAIVACGGDAGDEPESDSGAAEPAATEASSTETEADTESDSTDTEEAGDDMGLPDFT